MLEFPVSKSLHNTINRLWKQPNALADRKKKKITMEVTRRDDDTLLKNGSTFQMMKISQTTELLARFLKSQPGKCTLKIFKK